MKSQALISVIVGFFVGVGISKFLIPDQGIIIRGLVTASCVGAAVTIAILLAKKGSKPDKKAQDTHFLF